MLDFFPNIWKRTVLYVFPAVGVLWQCVCFHHCFWFPLSSCCLLSRHESRSPTSPRGCRLPIHLPSPVPPLPLVIAVLWSTACVPLVGFVLCLHVSLNGVFPPEQKLNSRLMHHIDMNPETQTKLVENFIKWCVCIYTTFKKKKKRSTQHFIWSGDLYLETAACLWIAVLIIQSSWFPVENTWGTDVHLCPESRGGKGCQLEVSLHRKESCHQGPFRMLE